LNRKRGFLILTILGLIAPCFFFVSFLLGHGLNGKEVIRELFATPTSMLLLANVVISSVAFVRFMEQEAARLAIGKTWVYLVALTAVGLSFALPLFLYVRESHLEIRSTPRGSA
jgi:hypothetical protein